MLCTQVGIGVVMLRTGAKRSNGSHETEVLLVRRAKAPEIGKWTVPGGSLELGEHVRGVCSQSAVHTRQMRIGVFCRALLCRTVSRHKLA